MSSGRTVSGVGVIVAVALASGYGGPTRGASTPGRGTIQRQAREAPARAPLVELPTAPVDQEVRPSQPSAGHVWTEGMFWFNGTAFVWLGGEWVLPPSTDVHWTPARWVEQQERWQLVPGHWEPLRAVAFVGSADPIEVGVTTTDTLVDTDQDDSHRRHHDYAAHLAIGQRVTAVATRPPVTESSAPFGWDMQMFARGTMIADHAEAGVGPGEVTIAFSPTEDGIYIFRVLARDAPEPVPYTFGLYPASEPRPGE